MTGLRCTSDDPTNHQGDTCPIHEGERICGCGQSVIPEAITGELMDTYGNVHDCPKRGHTHNSYYGRMNIMYAETSVIVNGALEETETFHDETLLREYVDTIAEEAAGHGYATELYVQYHDHADGVECECAQYETDHHPAHAWNVSD